MTNDSISRSNSQFFAFFYFMYTFMKKSRTKIDWKFFVFVFRQELRKEKRITKNVHISCYPKREQVRMEEENF